MKLRPANNQDIVFLWRLRNELTVRQVSLNTKTFPLSEHKKWFSLKMSSDECVIFIVETEQSKQIGQVRLDALSSTMAEISVALVKSERGKGYGFQAIMLALNEAKKRGFIQVKARIKDFNKNSLEVFKTAKFEMKNARKLDDKVNLIEMTRTI